MDVLGQRRQGLGSERHRISASEDNRTAGDPSLRLSSISGRSVQQSPSASGGASGIVEQLDDDILGWFRKRNGNTLKGALAFVPWILQQAYFEGCMDHGEIFIHTGEGTVVFSDASGFTALTERLAKKSNGAELLSQCLSSFFTPLIALINAYRGDVIKFSGDALTIYFPSFDDTKSPKFNGVVPPHGTFGRPDLGPMATSVLRASACCIEIHKRLHEFETGVDGVRLCLHIGIGCGQVSILQVGGVVPPECHVPRCEYIIAGQPIEQIADAEPLAKNGETCLSPQAWEFVKDCVIEGPMVKDRPEFHLLARMDENKFTFPTIKYAAMENDNRQEMQFRLSELNVIRRYIPWAVFKQIERGTLPYVNEMRTVTVIFISGAGLDVTSERGGELAQELMASVQRAVYQHEGTLNKFLIDDKGLTFLLVFGLPPLVHTDDPTRAVLACFDAQKEFRRLSLTGKFGVTTGRTYCGVCGSAQRMEYTVLGDCVNLAARLMTQAPAHGILCDEETKNRCTTEVVFNALAPIRVKGKANPIPIFQPELKALSKQIGLSIDKKIRFPWYDHPFGGASLSGAGSGVLTLQTNVTQLCGVKSWAGIVKVHELLGGSFNKAIHESSELRSMAPAHRAPGESPFAEGGVVVIEAPAGMGKIELAEHCVVYALTHFQMMPIFGAMGPRPGDSVRLATELLRSTIGIFRQLDEAVSDSDSEALQSILPPQKVVALPLLRQALQDPSSCRERGSDVLQSTLDVVTFLLASLVKRTPVLIVVQFEYGTSLFPRSFEDQKIFWEVVSELAEIVEREKKAAGGKPLVMMILIRDVPDAYSDNKAVNMARESGSFLHLNGLTEENILEYMANYLLVPVELVPKNLHQFIAKVTLGNPLYIREAIDQLQEQHIQVKFSVHKQPQKVICKALDNIDSLISGWQHTAMVGNTICQLESLDPLEAAALKMSICFAGPFTLPDLAASICSRWADATHFDFLRLYKAIHKLVTRNMLESIDDPQKSWRASDLMGDRVAGGHGQYFQTQNLLIRAVGGAMVLEAQKKAIKRQALIDRALQRELPARLEDLEEKKKAQHIPWYYEQAFRRMGRT